MIAAVGLSPRRLCLSCHHLQKDGAISDGPEHAEVGWPRAGKTLALAMRQVRRSGSPEQMVVMLGQSWRALPPRYWSLNWHCGDCFGPRFASDFRLMSVFLRNYANSRGLAVETGAMTQPGSAGASVLVHLASGVGNIVFATPLLLVLIRHGFTVDLLIDGDYADTAGLFDGWSALRAVYNARQGEPPTGPYDIRLPALPPFYWSRYAADYQISGNAATRPADALFYRDEQAYYLEFALSLGCEISEPPFYFVPAAPDNAHGIAGETLVLAPGCKTGEMAAKRWPYFPQLAEMFDDVVLTGIPDDLYNFDGSAMRFPDHVRSLVGQLSLRETAGILAAAGAVVANDSGLGHIAGAVGTPTVLLFGPTPDTTLGRLPPNVRVLRAGLACEPCWFGDRYGLCAGRVDCLPLIQPAMVATAIAQTQNQLFAIVPT